MKRFAVALLVLFTVSTLVTGTVVWRSLYTPVELDAAIVVDVLPGTGANKLAAQLVDTGVLRSPRIWAWYARLSGKAGQLQAGEYELPAGVTPLELMDLFVAGKVRLHAFTILEGWTVWEVLTALRAHPAIEQTLEERLDPEQLSSILGLPYPHAEGLFYPDTYNFPKGATDVSVLRQAATLMEQELNGAWENRSDRVALLKSPYDLLILASIVERETAVDDERAEIAGVFVRRLEKRMRLQTDPTVIYGIGPEFNGNITRRDLKTDTPYNTYTRSGLPPTPIGMPARQSLLAAGNPDIGTSLYFVAVGDGSGRHVFNDTLQGHNLAVAAYLRRLRSQREAAADGNN